MAKLENCIGYVLENEGGWTIDDGGWTMWGITVPDVAAYRKVPQSSITESDMKNLSKMEATEIYRELYWNKLSLDQVNSDAVATAIFDIGVNRGIAIGAHYAQKAAVLCGKSIAVDGAIGQQTIAAINVCQPVPFIQKLEALEMAGYIAIAASNPAKYERYLKGWEARAKRLLTLG